MTKTIFTRRIRTSLLLGAAWLVTSGAALAVCPPTTTAGDDTCLIESGTGPLDAQAGNDTFALGGPGSFTFNTARLGTDFLNFELFRKVGPSIVTLTGVTGQAVDWTVEQGTLIVSQQQAINAARSAVVQAGAFFEVTAPTLVMNTLNNAGSTVLAAATNLQIAQWVKSGNGALTLGVGLDTASQPEHGQLRSLLDIAGNAVGDTLVTINTALQSANPSATSGQGIRLITVAGTSTADSFRLANRVVEGGFEYILERSANLGGPGATFFLRSVPREELVANTVALAVNRATLQALSFFDQGADAAEGLGTRLRAWITAHGQTTRAAGDAGARFNDDMIGVTAGVDTGFTSNIRVGIKGGWGENSVDLKMPQGNGKLDGTTYVAQLYAQFISGPLMLDASAGYASTDWDFRTVAGVRISESIDGIIAAIGAAYRFEFPEPVSLTVAANLLYDGTSCGDGCFLGGIQEKTSDWFGRLSAKLESKAFGDEFRPYLSVSLTDDFGGGQKALFGQGAAKVNAQGAVFGLNAGLNVAVAPNAAFFAEAGLTRSLEADVDGYRAQAGFRVTW